jgi:hypothetical protein
MFTFNCVFTAECEKQLRKTEGYKEEISRLRQVSKDQEDVLRDYEMRMENNEVSRICLVPFDPFSSSHLCVVLLFRSR